MYKKALLLTSLVFLVFMTKLYAAPEKELWPRWQAYSKQSTATIDHNAFQQFLNKYVVPKNGIMWVNYSQVSKQDKQALNDYLQRLSNIKIKKYNREEQLAFWINLYNALTIKTILAHWPVESIRDIDISPGLFAFGPWDAKLISVDGVKLSLNDVEHRIIRPIWNDPLSHYALNCASYSCPNIQNKVFTAKNLRQMLKKSARQYINDPRGVKIEGKKLTASKIFDWYQIDFGKNDAQVIKHLMLYAKPDLKKKLTNFKQISNYEYNWDLNGN